MNSVLFKICVFKVYFNFHLKKSKEFKSLRPAIEIIGGGYLAYIRSGGSIDEGPPCRLTLSVDNYYSTETKIV